MRIKGIAALMLGELAQAMGEKQIAFSWDDALLEYLVEKSYSAVYGARNLRRLIQKELEDTIAVRLIEGYAHPVSQMQATAADGRIQLTAM